MRDYYHVTRDEGNASCGLFALFAYAVCILQFRGEWLSVLRPYPASELEQRFGPQKRPQTHTETSKQMEHCFVLGTAQTNGM